MRLNSFLPVIPATRYAFAAILAAIWFVAAPLAAQTKTDRLAIEGRCREKARVYKRAQQALDEALATETVDWIIYNRNQELERARENYCLCLAQMWNAQFGLKALPKEWDEYCDPRPPFDIEAERIRRGIGSPLRKGVPPQPGAPPDLSDTPVACNEPYQAYLESRRDFQEASKGERKKDERGQGQGLRELREKMVADYRTLCECWKGMATYLYEEYCTWSEQGPPPDLSSVGKTPATGGASPSKKVPEAPIPPPPPQPVSPISPGSGPAPPGPGMPAPPGPGMPAADCLREGAWSFTFTVEEHKNNHDHAECVKFLRRVLKAIFGGFAGDLFSAKFEDLLPEMQCSKIPGCGGTCKGTLSQFAGRNDVQFEIKDLRRTGDTLTGRLVVTSGGETLFILKFTATPAVTA